MCVFSDDIFVFVFVYVYNHPLDRFPIFSLSLLCTNYGEIDGVDIRIFCSSFRVSSLSLSIFHEKTVRVVVVVVKTAIGKNDEDVLQQR